MLRGAQQVALVIAGDGQVDVARTGSRRGKVRLMRGMRASGGNGSGTMAMASMPLSMASASSRLAAPGNSEAK